MNLCVQKWDQEREKEAKSESEEVLSSASTAEPETECLQLSVANWTRRPSLRWTTDPPARTQGGEGVHVCEDFLGLSRGTETFSC